MAGGLGWTSRALCLLVVAVALAGPAAAAVRRYDWRLTLATAAPDCWERPAILVNGELGPTLEVTQGDRLLLYVQNDIPSSYPDVLRGVSIHFHGWNLVGQPWFDGVGYVEQCPIQSGTNMTYNFTVNEPPGTYMWHGHTGADRADGLEGALIVRPKGDPIVPVDYDEERVLVLQDWWHTESGAMAMFLNRPFDPARQTPDSGGWVWANNPQAILINGNSFYADCAIGGGGSTDQPKCRVEEWWVPPGQTNVQPYASAVNPGCAHTNITVESGKTYLFRLISATNLVYQTICFEGHNVTVVAADARPIEPFVAPGGCVDINSGQRYDVLLKADQPKDSYWISSLVQYRPGSPAGYAVLRYRNSKKQLPPTKPPQPGSIDPWTPEQSTRWIKMSSELLNDVGRNAEGGLYYEETGKVPEPTLRITVNITQPLMKQTGQLRWGLNGISNQNPPPCTPLLDLVWRNASWIEDHVVPADVYNEPDFNASALGRQTGSDGNVQVFLSTPTEDGTQAEPPPIYPTAGRHILPLKRGEVLEVVLQNLPANANGGDYTGANRTGEEQHPFHLHGHHFWLLGSGLGVYDPKANRSDLNLENPPFRDTATLPKGGWVVFRFNANNPGLWILHCHLLWHEWMGQVLVVAEDVDGIVQLSRPAGLPNCPDTCTFNGAPWSNTAVDEEFGDSGFELPTGG